MPNKYIIHGATFCGDGTSSALAASNGAAGAWNNINVMEGAAPDYGTPVAAGDTVFIRSKTAAGADMLRTLVATIAIGSTAATEAAWVKWVLDNGVIWPDTNGTLTYNCPSTFSVNARSYNLYAAMAVDAFKIVETNAAASYKTYFASDAWATSNLLFDFGLAATANGSYFANQYGWRHENVHIIARRHSGAVLTAASYGKSTLINPKIELLEPSSNPVINVGGHLHIVGGSVEGAGAVAGSTLLSVGGDSIVESVSLSLPRQMTAVNPLVPTSSTYAVNMVGTDSSLGALIREGWGLADSRDDNNYPKLNAILPNTDNTPWSWKLCPLTTTEQHPLKMVMCRYYTDIAGIRKITLNLLVANTLLSAVIPADKSTVWMDVEYIDNATGRKRLASTRDHTAGALDSSDALWSATTYGPASLTKKRLSVTTPTAIKQNTLISITLRARTKAASATDESNDIMFMCPEFEVTTP